MTIGKDIQCCGSTVRRRGDNGKPQLEENKIDWMEVERDKGTATRRSLLDVARRFVNDPVAEENKVGDTRSRHCFHV